MIIKPNQSSSIPSNSQRPMTSLSVVQSKTDLASIRYERGSLWILDQMRLPYEFVYIPILTVDDAWKAIHTMSVRGPSAIAVSGMLSVAVELHYARSKFDCITAVKQFVTDQLNYLITARPSTIYMIDAAKTVLNYLLRTAHREETLNGFIDDLIEYMEQFLVQDLTNNRAIGQIGVEMLIQTFTSPKKFTILTHCNTGSLATVGFGTALGIIRELAKRDLLQLVYFTETRPINQGSRLTAYELLHDRIPHTMICDSMVGHLMKTHRIHAVIVGGNCVTATGDTMNKIGTYQLAILADYHRIPFYVAVPIMSIDLTKKTGDDIDMEQRPSSEITTIKGMNIAAEGVQVWNPTFDITPAYLITGIITERGVFKPNELEEKLYAIKFPYTDS